MNIVYMLVLLGVILFVLVRSGMITGVRLPMMREGLTDEATFTFYKMAGCGHCKAFQPEWDNLTKMGVAGVKFEVLDVSNPEDRPKVEAAGVSAFPTMIFHMGEKSDSYEGERKAEAIKAYLEEKLKA